MASAAEHEAMTRALAIASGIQSRPLIPTLEWAAVLLDRDGRVVGTGFHPGPGHPHAEVAALAAAGSAARGATAVVTLEPCSHFGRTGPCASALVSRRRAIGWCSRRPIPTRWPPEGPQCFAPLESTSKPGVLADEARALNPIWSFAMERRRPLVTWKFAATVDGRVAAADGTSRWISGEQLARRGASRCARWSTRWWWEPAPSLPTTPS